MDRRPKALYHAERFVATFNEVRSHREYFVAKDTIRAPGYSTDVKAVLF